MKIYKFFGNLIELAYESGFWYGAVFAMRVFISCLFLLSAIPKMLGQGASPSLELISKIKARTASWYELEVTAAVYVWDVELKLPPSVLPMFGVVIITAILLLNLAPPPSNLGIGATIFLLAILGGGIHAWAFAYRSVKHSGAAFLSVFMLAAGLHDSFSFAAQRFLVVVVPIYIGFVVGSSLTVYRLNYGKVLGPKPPRRKRGNLI